MKSVVDVCRGPDRSLGEVRVRLSGTEVHTNVYSSVPLASPTSDSQSCPFLGTSHDTNNFYVLLV